MPYFVLPDGTEVDLVDLHVDNYVPYLFDDGDVTMHRAVCSYEILSVTSEVLPPLILYVVEMHTFTFLHLLFNTMTSLTTHLCVLSHHFRHLMPLMLMRAFRSS